MNPTVESWSRVGRWLLPLHALLLAAATLTHQPDPAADFTAYARYVTTDAFLLSHLVGSILGAALGVVGAFAVLPQAVATRRAGTAVLGAGLFAIGSVLVTALFAVAAFAQPAIGRAFLAGDRSMVRFDEDVYGPPLLVTAVVGLLTFVVGAALLGRAIAGLPRLAGPGTVYAWSLPVAALAGFALPALQPVAAAVAAVAAALVAHRLGAAATTPLTPDDAASRPPAPEVRNPGRRR